MKYSTDVYCLIVCVLFDYGKNDPFYIKNAGDVIKIACDLYSDLQIEKGFILRHLEAYRSYFWIKEDPKSNFLIKPEKSVLDDVYKTTPSEIKIIAQEIIKTLKFNILERENENRKKKSEKNRKEAIRREMWRKYNKW